MVKARGRYPAERDKVSNRRSADHLQALKLKASRKTALFTDGW